jgi:hypothetical protein
MFHPSTRHTHTRERERERERETEMKEIKEEGPGSDCQPQIFV